MWQQLLEQLKDGDFRALARSISFVENEHEGFDQLLMQLPAGHAQIIGITGPPGAGKSTLVDALIGEMIRDSKKVAVLCVDPSSPFHLGAVLGDRIRMSEWYTHPNVFIRSLASRRSMGGLHPRIIEISDLVKAAGYDYVIIETVGVGQSEVDIAGLADTTVVVLVPESGDEVQTMKAGLMEIADVFVVNKCDRPDADAFVKSLRMMLAPAFSARNTEVPIIKTVASEHKGVDQLYAAIKAHLHEVNFNEKKLQLLTERIYFLIQKKRMKDIDKKEISTALSSRIAEQGFNLYQFAEQYNQHQNLLNESR